MFNFEKQGIEFSFRNPRWDKFYGQLRMEYKAVGMKENKENDGYFYNSTFMQDKNAMGLNNIKINGKEAAGVGLPEPILTEIKALYEKLKADDLQGKLTKDIKYTLNDADSYGIYNGISRLDIEAIVADIKKKYNSDILLFAEEICEILNRDEELKQIAIESYTANQEGNWNEEYLTWFRQAAKEKRAPGHGIILNDIIRAKITNIILAKIEAENKEKQKEQDIINNLFEIAKQTGEKQFVAQWAEDCNDKNEECNTDICCKWAMPNGTIEQTRNHTW